MSSRQFGLLLASLVVTCAVFTVGTWYALHTRQMQRELDADIARVEQIDEQIYLICQDAKEERVGSKSRESAKEKYDALIASRRSILARWPELKSPATPQFPSGKTGVN